MTFLHCVQEVLPIFVWSLSYEIGTRLLGRTVKHRLIMLFIFAFEGVSANSSQHTVCPGPIFIVYLLLTRLFGHTVVQILL